MGGDERGGTERGDLTQVRNEQGDTERGNEQGDTEGGNRQGDTRRADIKQVGNKPRRQERGARRREALVAAAAAIILSEGPAAVTHRAVARRAGSSLSATTYYFEDLADLIGSAGAEIMANWAAQAEDVAEAAEHARHRDEAPGAGRARAPEDAREAGRARAPREANRARAPEDAREAGRARAPEAAGKAERTGDLEDTRKTEQAGQSERASSSARARDSSARPRDTVASLRAPSPAALRSAVLDALLPPVGEVRGHYQQLLVAGAAPALAAAYREGRHRLDAAVARILAAYGSACPPEVAVAVVDGAVVSALSEGRDVRKTADALLDYVL